MYTIVTLFSLFPAMELAFTSCAQSSSSSGVMSSMVSPCATRTYTCALLIFDTWNHTSSGKPYLIRSSFSTLSLPMYSLCFVVSAPVGVK